MTERFDVVIVGAGHGGAQAAAALRQHQFTGTIALVSDDPELPYERPPLSKEYLAGDRAFERILLRPAGFWAERSIELRPGHRVTAVDAAAHEVRLAEGSTLGYGALVWAAGGAPRRLACSGHDLGGVHTIRSRADVDALRSEVGATDRAVVIGGGTIGLESAAGLRKLGLAVTLLEAQDRVLSRIAAPPLSRWFESEHRAHGVDLRLGARVACLEGSNGRVTGVRLDDGELLPTALVIAGIGITPSVGPLLAAGARGDDGVLVDLQGKTSLPDVYALGDCAAHPNVHAHGATVRLESVQNATDMATIVARALTGSSERYEALPWFWSNQYDVRLQTIGLSVGHDEVLVRGSLDARSFSLVYLRAGRVIALDCVNAARDYVQGKALIVSGREVDRGQLADPSVPLKSLA